MKKQEVLDILSVLEKEHFEKAFKEINEKGFPKKRRSYLYDIIDPETGNKCPPPYTIQLAYKDATG